MKALSPFLVSDHEGEQCARVGQRPPSRRSAKPSSDGAQSVRGRSIVIHRADGSRWACAGHRPAAVERKARMQKATSTGKGDKETVPVLYTDVMLKLRGGGVCTCTRSYRRAGRGTQRLVDHQGMGGVAEPVWRTGLGAHLQRHEYLRAQPRVLHASLAMLAAHVGRAALHPARRAYTRDATARGRTLSQRRLDRAYTSTNMHQRKIVPRVATVAHTEQYGRH